VPHTDSVEVITQYIVDLLEANKVALGLTDVWYGDQQLVPRTPSCAVEAGPKNRALAAMPRVTQNSFIVYVLVYVAKIQDVQSTHKTAIQMAEAIEEVLHGDPTMGDNVIHGYCTSIEPGYAVRGGTLMRASRITWEGLTKLRIGA
jgi:hypothetical protein